MFTESVMTCPASSIKPVAVSGYKEGGSSEVIIDGAWNTAADASAASGTAYLRCGTRLEPVEGGY